VHHVGPHPPLGAIDPLFDPLDERVRQQAPLPGAKRRGIQPGIPGGHIAAHRVVIHPAQGGRAIRARQVERLEYVHDLILRQHVE